MANNRISVLIDVTVDKANRAIESFRKSVSDADGVVGKFKAGSAAAFASLKANALPVAAASGAALYKLGGAAVDAASAMEQSVGAVEKSFGDASDEVLEFAENAAESAGLSTRAYADAAVRLGSFAKQIANDTGKPVAEVLNDLIIRSSDLAATFGVSVSDAIAKVSSGLAGESEPLRAWGIDMRKTAIQSHAAAEGIDDMSEATQAAGLLFSSSSDYAGQFADESETLAGQQERLAAELENMMAALGEGLTPIIAEATRTIRDLLDIVESVEEPLEATGLTIGDVTMAVSDAVNPIGTWRRLVVDAARDAGILGGQTDELTEAVTESDDAYGSWASRIEEAHNPIEELTTAVDKHTRATERGAAEIERKSKKMDEARQAIIRSTEATLGAIDADLGYRQSMESTAAVLGDAEASALDVEAAILSQASAALRLAEDQAEANGKTLTASDRNAVYRAELEKLVAEIDGPAADAIRRHIEALGRIPATVQTALSVNGRSPTASVNGYRASGGPVSAGGTYVVGEEGPELLQMGSSGGNVIPNGATVGGGGFNVGELHLHGVQDPDAMVRALRQYARRNGPIQGIT